MKPEHHKFLLDLARRERDDLKSYRDEASQILGPRHQSARELAIRHWIAGEAVRALESDRSRAA